MPRDAMRRARSGSGSGGVRAACNYDNFNRQLSGITPAPGARPPTPLLACPMGPWASSCLRFARALRCCEG
jgi:hypothetical protein